MPRPFRTYLFLLDYVSTAGMFPMRTGFELAGDQVYMLDVVERGAVRRQNGGPGQLDVVMLAEYGLPASDFLDIIRRLLGVRSN